MRIYGIKYGYGSGKSNKSCVHVHVCEQEDEFVLTSVSQIVIFFLTFLIVTFDLKQ